ncbi:chain-length determining protein [Brevundimonas balnearis]|uniref:Chain-length determining protein n=1 Tax=Brevundimonas balnearis TaxID=1572858 RepID=A0ABV6QYJ4_9CAUL
MSDARITYLGPTGTAQDPAPARSRKRFGGLGGARLAFVLVVVVPTLITAFYYLVVAAPRYVSEARFVVRAAEQPQTNGLGIALQGVGLTQSPTDAFALHEYITSRDAVADLERQMDLRAMLSRPGVDPLSRHPRFWEGDSAEGLYSGLQRFITVGYHTPTGISTLRVEAFTPEDAQRMAQTLLNGGEALVNRLNERAAARNVADAERTVVEAERRLSDIQQRLTAFRNREGIVDPTVSVTEGSALTAELAGTIASLRAERSQLQSQAPQSPQLAIIDARIAAYERQLAAERAKITGNQSSLASKIGVYESLMLERELADRSLATASTALDTAREDSRRQQLYLERVVNPGLPDKATEPKRLRAILAVFLSTSLIFAIGWLVWAGLREHRQIG